jgi:hypothetical protein
MRRRKRKRKRRRAKLKKKRRQKTRRRTRTEESSLLRLEAQPVWKRAKCAYCKNMQLKKKFFLNILPFPSFHGKVNILNLSLKVHCHEIFDSRFFHSVASEKQAKPVLRMTLFWLRKCSKLRPQWHRGHQFVFKILLSEFEDVCETDFANWKFRGSV